MNATKLIVLGIKIYKATLSKLLVMLFGNGCRFYPTCSVYAQEAISKHGVTKGTALSVKRFLRCHPFSKKPFIDLVPKSI